MYTDPKPIMLMSGDGVAPIANRSRWRDNGRLYAVPKFYRHTASVSRGQINPIDPLAGTSRWDLNPIDPLPGTTRGCVQHE